MGGSGVWTRRSKSRLRAGSPGARTSTGVGNREDPQLLGGDQVCDPVGEAGDRELAD